MDIQVNGDISDVPPGSTLAWLLLSLEINQQAVAVARNGEVVPRAGIAQCVLEPDDRVEIVRAVGGG